MADPRGQDTDRADAGGTAPPSSVPAARESAGRPPPIPEQPRRDRRRSAATGRAESSPGGPDSDAGGTDTAGSGGPDPHAGGTDTAGSGTPDPHAGGTDTAGSGAPDPDAAGAVIPDPATPDPSRSRTSTPDPSGSRTGDPDPDPGAADPGASAPGAPGTGGSATDAAEPASRSGRAGPRYGPGRAPEPPLRDGDGRTHRVENQPPPLAGFDALACDPALTDAVGREGADEALPALQQLAAFVTSPQAREHARLAETHPPVLHTHDRYGHRIDEVEFHPSWHELMRTAVGWGLHGTPWVADPGSGAHVARAAGFYLMGQLESGHCCPVSMTYAAVPALRRDPDLAAAYVPGLQSRTYDHGLAEPSTKAGLLAGMSMTEKQGGSDVRAGTTSATPVDDGTYRLVGHKWFTSAPMNDVFLTLAQAPGGLTCFVLPRVLPDGTRNAIRLQRLKDKLGNRSNASAEIEYTGAVAWRLGEEGRGVATIIDMVSMTRLDCVLGSAALTRAALTEASHHVAHRSAFGARLADTPLMQTVIADLALESEAATALALRLAGAVDREERAFLRLALPAAKYLVCKRAPAVVAEALECLGGNGYVEESGMPRLYREAPLNSIWEGSGNVTALDVLRAVTREPDSVDAMLAEVDAAAGADTWFDRGARELRTELRSREERRARRLAEMIALCLQGSLLLRHAPNEVSSAFVSSRFLPDGPWRTSGTLPAAAHTEALLNRVTPG